MPDESMSEATERATEPSNPSGVSALGASYSGFIRATIFRPVGVFVVFVALLVVGVLSYPQIPLQLVPSGMSSSNCFIYIPVPDATPREVMEHVAKPCEDYLRTVPGIVRVVSSSSARSCRLHIEFSPKADPDVLVAELRDRMDRAKAEWLEGMDDYFLWRQSETDIPILVCALSMDADEDRVDIDYLFEELISKRLMAVDGVARVEVHGLLEKRVEIGIDPNRLDAYAVDLRRLIQRLAADNRTINAGSIRQEDTELLVRFDGTFKNFAELRRYPAGGTFRVEDFAKVGYAQSVKEWMSRAGGHRSRTIVVQKESSANAVDVCRRLNDALDELKESLERTVPGVTRVEILSWMNQGEMISFSVASLRESALWGGAFAVVVLYAFFRRLGMTLLVTLAIPFSLLITVIWIFFRGGTFNLMSLMGMSLGIGMLVDNSIVVVENIVSKREEGLSMLRATIEGVREVGLAVTLATLTTVMVFTPILFLDDPRLKVMSTEIGEPLCVSVLASLLVALVFVPQGALHLHEWGFSRTGRARGEGPARGPRVFAWLRRRVGLPPPARRRAREGGPRRDRYSAVNHYSASMTRVCLRHPLESIVVVGLLMTASYFALDSLPKKGIPRGGPARLEVQVTMPKNFTLAEADQAIARMQEAVLAHREELKVRAVTSWFQASSGELDLFLETGERVEEEEFFERLRPLLPVMPGVVYRFGHDDFGREEETARLRIYIRGTNLKHLEALAERVKARLKEFPDLTEVTRWRRDERDEIRVDVARRLAQEYDIDTTTVSRAVAWALRGAALSDFLVDDREYPFWVSYGDSVKEDVRVLDEIRVFRPDGRFVRLENLADYAISPGLGEIHRIDGRMTIGFSARIESERPHDEVRAEVARYFKHDFPGVPDDSEVSLSRGDDYRAEMENAGVALVMAFSLVFFLMGILFESFLLPLSVLCVVPFALFGSVTLLWLTGSTLDPIGIIGTVILVGIVVNNAIVLVDQVNRLRGRGVPRDEALLQAVRMRFRPIWMTALTTVFGLLPLLILRQKGEGIDYKPLAKVLAGGLTTSTFFTLYMVPLFYTLLDNLRGYVINVIRLAARGERWRSARPEPSGPAR